MTKKSDSISTKLILTLVIVALLFGFLGGAITNRVAIPLLIDYKKSAAGHIVERQTQTTYVEESSIIEAVSKVGPSVVSIIATKDIAVGTYDPFSIFNHPFFGLTPNQNQQQFHTEQRQIGGGSGFIITSDGVVTTNKHVISDEQVEYTVVLSDGREFPAEVIALDPLTDIGFLRMKTSSDGDKPTGLPAVELGGSSQLQVGQRVVAIGYALAQYQNTVTTGVISAMGRNITASDQLGQTSETLTGLIQTDAAINPGNSGGPLINLSGQVVGINTAIDNSAAGIGFALAIDDVKPVVDSILSEGKILRPYLGVRFTMIDAALAQKFNLEGVEHGALLVGDVTKGEFAVLPDSPAAKAGLKINDVIVAVDGEELTVDNPLQQVIAKRSVGETVSLTVWRDGEILPDKIKVQLEKYEVE